MSNPNYTDVKRDVGDVWAGIDGTTTIIVKSMIDRAQVVIKNITGTTTGDNQDAAIRALSDAFAVQNVLGGLGPETGDKEALINMRDKFYSDADQALRVMAKSLNYYKVQFNQVNP